jgi:hypothetical protein
MEPSRAEPGALVYLLDRVLEQGLVLDADVIIHVAGVPLIGVKLQALVAGMETMLKYGIWEDWDAALRARESGRGVVPEKPTAPAGSKGD